MPNYGPLSLTTTFSVLVFYFSVSDYLIFSSYVAFESMLLNCGILGLCFLRLCLWLYNMFNPCPLRPCIWFFFLWVYASESATFLVFVLWASQRHSLSLFLASMSQTLRLSYFWALRPYISVFLLWVYTLKLWHSWSLSFEPTLLEKILWISLYATDDTIAMLYGTSIVGHS